MLQLLRRDVHEKGADGGQAGVAALGFEVDSEGPGEVRVQIGETHGSARFLQFPRGIVGQQAEGFPVADNANRTDLSLLHRAIGEKRAQQPGEVGGELYACSIRAVRSSRRAASRSSSGAAVRYQ